MKKINWGIAGPGNIARKFAEACNICEQATLYGIASTNPDRAKQFADTYNATKSYNNYQEMVDDEDIDAIYIATINTFHMPIIEQCIKAGKPVLCEKPCVLTEADAIQVETLSKQYDVLVMEALWSVFLPANRKVKQWISEDKLGKLRHMESNFSYFMNYDYSSRVFDKDTGGGAMFDIGVYCIAYSIEMLGYPIDMHSTLQYGPTNVDEFGCTTLVFKDNVTAVCRYGIMQEMDSVATIYGENGYITVNPFWDATKCELFDRHKNLVESFSIEPVNGFLFQLEHFNQLIIDGKKQSDIMPFSTSRMYAKIYDDAINRYMSSKN